MFFLILGHVNAHHVGLVVEQELRQGFGKLGFPHTGRPQEEERADGTVGILQTRASQPNRLGDPRESFILSDHPLAQATEPSGDAELLHHRAIVIADSARDHRSRSFGLLAGQPTFTVSSLQAKLDAQLRGLGAGFLPEALARPHLQAGRLVARRIERGSYGATLHYAWRASAVPGRALSWWLERLERPVTRRALLEGRASV